MVTLGASADINGSSNTVSQGFNLFGNNRFELPKLGVDFSKKSDQRQIDNSRKEINTAVTNDSRQFSDNSSTSFINTFVTNSAGAQVETTKKDSQKLQAEANPTISPKSDASGGSSFDQQADQSSPLLGGASIGAIAGVGLLGFGAVYLFSKSPQAKAVKKATEGKK